MDEIKVMQDCRTSVGGRGEKRTMRPTSNTCEELTCKALDLRTGKWYKAVAFEKIKDTLTQKIGDNADVVPKVE